MLQSVNHTSSQTGRRMKHTTRRTCEQAVVSCVLLAGLFPAGALAAEGGLLKALHPYAQLGIGYDSNVFRVETAALAGDLITGSELDDTVSTIETGINAKLTHQRQVFSAWGRVFHNDYSHFDEVDFTGADAKLGWEWAAGTRWSGNVGYEFRRGLRDFANQTVPRIDVTSTN